MFHGHARSARNRDSSSPPASLPAFRSSSSVAFMDSMVARDAFSSTSSREVPQNAPLPKIWAPGAEPCQPGWRIPTPGSVSRNLPSSLTVIGPAISHFPLS